MDNNLFSLFDDTPESPEELNKDKKPKTTKKKSNKNATINNLFLFEEVEALTPAIENEIKDVIDATDDKNTSLPLDNVMMEIGASDVAHEMLESELGGKVELDDEHLETALNEEVIKESADGVVDEINGVLEDDTTSIVENEQLSVGELLQEEILQKDNEILDNKTVEAEIDLNKEEVAKEDLDTLFTQEVVAQDFFAAVDNDIVDEAKDETNLEDIRAKSNEIIAENLSEVLDNTLEVASLPEWTLNKKYYSIGEVAKLFDVNTSHIRFWSKEFNFRLRTTRKGDRMYTVDDIDKLRLIHELVKVKKHTIKGAKEILSTNKKKVVAKVDLKDQLKDLKSLLLGIQSKL